MRYLPAHLLAYLLLILSASAQFVSYPAASSSSSVVTNDATSVVFSNSLTAAVGVNGSTDYSNGFYVAASFSALTWYNSTNTSYSIQHSGNNDGELGWTNTTAFADDQYVARVTCVASRGPGTIGALSLRIISVAGSPLASVVSSNNPLGQTITCGYTGANVRGVSILRNGGLGQTSTLDFNDLYLTSGTTSITTNSGSGAGGASISVGGSKVGVTP